MGCKDKTSSWHLNGLLYSYYIVKLSHYCLYFTEEVDFRYNYIVYHEVGFGYSSALFLGCFWVLIFVCFTLDTFNMPFFFSTRHGE